jgi:hypothetical protein
MLAFEKHSSLSFECVNYMQTSLTSWISYLRYQDKAVDVYFCQTLYNLLYELFYTHKPVFYIFDTVCLSRESSKLDGVFFLKINIFKIQELTSILFQHIRVFWDRECFRISMTRKQKVQACSRHSSFIQSVSQHA